VASNGCTYDFSPTIGCGQSSLLYPGVILDPVVHCPGHECAHRIRSFCCYRDGYFLRLGTASHILHSRIRILMCSWLCLRLSARCVAFRCGRTDMVGNCCEKVVDPSKTENPNLRADEILEQTNSATLNSSGPTFAPLSALLLDLVGLMEAVLYKFAFWSATEHDFALRPRRIQMERSRPRTPQDLCVWSLCNAFTSVF